MWVSRPRGFPSKGAEATRSRGPSVEAGGEMKNTVLAFPAGAVLNLEDRSSRPHGCPHQMAAELEARVLVLRDAHPLEAVVADNLVQIYHRDVLVASHVQRRPAGSTPRPPRQGRRTARAATSGIVVIRVVDNNGDVSFAGTMYRAGRASRGKQVEVSIVAGSVQIACAGTIVRTHAIRHDPAKEHGAYATPHGRPRKPRQDAPNGAAVKAMPPRGRPEGRALTPAP